MSSGDSVEAIVEVVLNVVALLIDLVKGRKICRRKVDGRARIDAPLEQKIVDANVVLLPLHFELLQP